MPIKLILPFCLYGGLALLREFLAILYYRSVIAESAGLVATLNFLLECMDFLVLGLVLSMILRHGDFTPALIYAVFSSLGSYAGVKFKRKK